MARSVALLCLVMLSVVTGQQVQVTPREEVRRVGEDVTVLCKVAYTIDSCRMTVGQQSHRLIPSIQEGNVVYAGQGLQFGECGAHIRNIQEDWNGNVTCVLPPQSGSIEVTGTMRLIVARAPGDPQLFSPDRPTFREGDPFTAQCLVPDGRPAARITWFLEEDPLLVGPHQPVITQEPGTDLQTIAQNITRTLQADDNGKRLVCRAEHQALSGARTATRQLLVHYPPKRLESGPITIFGLKLGAEGRLNVTVRANPPPRVQWTVADQRLLAGHTDHTNNIRILEPSNLGNGYYNCTLVLVRVNKEDVDRPYYLQVGNDLGTEDFVIRISTMDEPAGLELEAGAIVGIVIAVLVLLLAVFLVVFAKATDRWCFAGRSHRTAGADSEAPLPPHDHHSDNAGGRRDLTKSSGESTPAAGDVLLESSAQARPAVHSDTESAVGGRGERSRLAELSARVRAALPRAKDKVQAVQVQDQPAPELEQKSVPEDKKGVVYAELSLGEQPGVDKPPPPSAEYAEIVYGGQGKD